MVNDNKISKTDTEGRVTNSLCDYCRSVYLCCFDLTCCLRCFVYWDESYSPPARSGSGSRGDLGSLWEKTMWRYWRCWSEAEGDSDEDSEAGDYSRHFHRYCECDAELEEEEEWISEELEISSDTGEEMSFESTFERDMLLNFTDLGCQQVVTDINCAVNIFDKLLSKYFCALS